MWQHENRPNPQSVDHVCILKMMQLNAPPRRHRAAGTSCSEELMETEMDRSEQTTQIYYTTCELFVVSDYKQQYR